MSDAKAVARLRHLLESKSILRVTDDSKRYEGIQFMGGPPLEFYILIITLAANFATIAAALHSFLRDKRNSRRSLLLKFNGKMMRISGSWSKEEIHHVLSKFSKVVTESERKRVISVIGKEKKNELKKRLEELDRFIDDYEEIVNGFKNMPRLEKWQEQRKWQYSKKLDRLKKEREKIKEVLG